MQSTPSSHWPDPNLLTQHVIADGANMVFDQLRRPGVCLSVCLGHWEKGVRHSFGNEAILAGVTCVADDKHILFLMSAHIANWLSSRSQK